ncbi:MAG: hypothetical protein IH986_04665 [Planctomycetes bacterium]|nr:hypothetical protein [Planctomycetota bacterium]
MGSIFGGILCPLLGVLLGIAASVLLLRRSRRQRYAEQKQRDEIERRCARCGYDLRGLELPRCPECGTLWGFRVPLDELGLSEDELRDSYERRRQERADRGANSPTPRDDGD